MKPASLIVSSLVLSLSCLVQPTWADITRNKIDFSTMDRMIIFGDSLSDYGNTGTVNAAYQGWSTEANELLPDIPGWPSPFNNDRRFTNGNMWSVYFSQSVQANNNAMFQTVTSMDAARALPYNPYFADASVPYLEVLGVNLGGVNPSDYNNTPSDNGSLHQNWAWGGAQTTNTPLVSVDLIDLDDGYFLSSVSTQIDAFTSAGNTFDSETVTFLWAGANDYILFGDATTGLTTIAEYISGFVAVPPVDLGTTAAQNQLDNLQSLIDDGAENIVLMNLPDIGKTPGAIAGDFDQASASLTPSQYVSDFNTTLENGIDGLTGDANIVLVDIFSALDDIIANPSAYGLDPSLIQESVVANEGNKTSDLEFNPLVTSDEINNNDFDEWLFWDHVHPTQAGHQLLGQTIYQAAVVPEPTSTSLLGLALVYWATRRRATL